VQSRDKYLARQRVVLPVPTNMFLPEINLVSPA
jgi:hypothetical protein